LNTDSRDVKIGFLSFVLAWRFLELYSLPELVTCHFPFVVKAYNGPAEIFGKASYHKCNSTLVAPAGGAAAAAPERGALAGPSAPTSTSTRWAMVAP
jgi:hypothetical protein